MGRKSYNRQNDDLFSWATGVFKWGYRYGGIGLSFVALGTISLIVCGLWRGIGMEINFIPFGIALSFLALGLAIMFLNKKF